MTGIVLLAIASTCLVLMTTWGGNTYDWNSPVIIGLIAGAIVAGVTFVFVERRAAEPIMPLHLFKDRNFNLTTIVGLHPRRRDVRCAGLPADVPADGHRVERHQAGLLMIPLMAALLIASVVSGQIVSRTGRYKWLPMTDGAGRDLAVPAVHHDAGAGRWIVCGYLAIMGLGLGMSMQILILVVQNSFPVTEVGTATASNNYFRQIGASLGSAIVGSLFVAKLTQLLTERMPAGAGAGGGGRATR